MTNDPQSTNGSILMSQLNFIRFPLSSSGNKVVRISVGLNNQVYSMYLENGNKNGFNVLRNSVSSNTSKFNV